MNNLLLLIVLAAGSPTPPPRITHGYAAPEGTYVAPYRRSAPDDVHGNSYGSQTTGGQHPDELGNPPAHNKQPGQ